MMLYESNTSKSDEDWNDNWDENWDNDVHLEDIHFEDEQFDEITLEAEKEDVNYRSKISLGYPQNAEEKCPKDTSRSGLGLELTIGEDASKYKANREYSIFLASALGDAGLKLHADSHVEKLLNTISVEVKNMASFKVVSSYDSSDSFVRSLINEEEDEKPFGDVLASNYINWLTKPGFGRFEEWLTLDHSGIFKAVVLNPKTDSRMLEILWARTLNLEKLEQIGSKYNISRERVRQIEKLGQQIVHRELVKLRITDLISLRHHDKGIVTVDDLQQEFGDYWWIIFVFLKSVSLSDIQFERSSNTFWLCTKEEAKKLKKAVSNLPECFEADRLCELLSVSNVKEFHISVVNEQFNQKDGMFYSRQTSLERICENILRECFPEGVHIHDEDEMSLFWEIAAERYGNKNLPPSIPALGPKIAAVGVMCDKGKYKIKLDRYISDSLISELYKYITSGRKESYSYKELFEVFQAELRKQGVSNIYYLQGILKETVRPKCCSSRINVIWKRSGVSLYNRNMSSNYKAPFCVDDVDLSKVEIGYLRNMMEACLVGRKYVFSQDIYDKLIVHSRPLLERNNIFQPRELFVLLRWLFGSEYLFNGLYVMKKTEGK